MRKCINYKFVIILYITIISGVVHTPHLEVDLKACLKITSFNV